MQIILFCSGILAERTYSLLHAVAEVLHAGQSIVKLYILMSAGHSSYHRISPKYRSATEKAVPP
jgi:predicted transcriptional regulator